MQHTYANHAYWAICVVNHDRHISNFCTLGRFVCKFMFYLSKLDAVTQLSSKGWQIPFFFFFSPSFNDIHLLRQYGCGEWGGVRGRAGAGSGTINHSPRQETGGNALRMSGESAGRQVGPLDKKQAVLSMQMCEKWVERGTGWVTGRNRRHDQKEKKRWSKNKKRRLVILCCC